LEKCTLEPSLPLSDKTEAASLSPGLDDNLKSNLPKKNIYNKIQYLRETRDKANNFFFKQALVNA